jgi:hypothetical protein
MRSHLPTTLKRYWLATHFESNIETPALATFSLGLLNFPIAKRIYKQRELRHLYYWII